jgi:hypothetical protein
MWLNRVADLTKACSRTSTMHQNSSSGRHCRHGPLTVDDLRFAPSKRKGSRATHDAGVPVERLTDLLLGEQLGGWCRLERGSVQCLAPTASKKPVQMLAPCDDARLCVDRPYLVCLLSTCMPAILYHVCMLHSHALLATPLVAAAAAAAFCLLQLPTSRIVEIYSLTRAVSTSHSETLLLHYPWSKTGANIKWVDDEHALAVFPSAEAAQTQLQSAQLSGTTRFWACAKASRAALHIAPEGKKKEYGWLHGFRNKGSAQCTAAGSACVQLRSLGGGHLVVVCFTVLQHAPNRESSCAQQHAWCQPHKRTVCPAELMPPHAARLKTTTAVARRLISNALGNSQVRE